MALNEAHTRAQRVDADLARAGGATSRRNLLEEVLLRTGEPDADYAHTGFADYVLLDAAGKPIAVVEAKRSSRDEHRQTTSRRVRRGHLNWAQS